MDVSNARKDFALHGYAKLSVAFDDNEVNTLLKIVKKRSFAPIFAVVGGRTDPKRCEAPLVMNERNQVLFDRVTFIIQRLDANWEIKKCSVLKSKPGGEAQEVHRDYLVEDVRKEEKATGTPPASILLALMDDTRLRVYDYSEDEVEARTVQDIVLNKTECLLFRGDQPHCGLGYTKINYRIHFYIGHRKTPFGDGNATYHVNFKIYKCPFTQCRHIFELKERMHNHKYQCRFNPLTKEKRKRNRLKNAIISPLKCSHCPKIYQRWSTYRKHLRDVNEKLPPSQAIKPLPKSDFLQLLD